MDVVPVGPDLRASSRSGVCALRRLVYGPYPDSLINCFTTYPRRPSRPARRCDAWEIEAAGRGLRRDREYARQVGLEIDEERVGRRPSFEQTACIVRTVQDPAAPRSGEWWFSVRCDTCSRPIYALRDSSNGDKVIRPQGPGAEFRLTCPSGHRDCIPW